MGPYAFAASAALSLSCFCGFKSLLVQPKSKKIPTIIGEQRNPNLFFIGAIVFQAFLIRELRKLVEPVHGGKSCTCAWRFRRVLVHFAAYRALSEAKSHFSASMAIGL
jgi:hypothetical protein